MDRTRIAVTSKAVNEALAKFEKEEAEFQKRDRSERANDLFGSINIVFPAQHGEVPFDISVRRDAADVVD